MSLSQDESLASVEAAMRKIYSEAVIDHALNPRNLGHMKDADGLARVTSPDGDTVEIALKVDGDVITRAAFWTDACAATVASASMLGELARGKSITTARRISQRDVLNALGGLPEGNEHCALLVANALRAAIRDHLDIKKEPWKKNYRRQ
ncbi:MAG: iron-sulfur cluster assembly scaffold protein [Chloroflexota bacterium]